MGFGRLSAVQRVRVDEWLPGAEVVADLSWNQVETVVLRVRHAERELIVKASGDADHHMGRELDAHEGGFVSPWQHGGHAALLLHADRAARVLVLDWLPGVLAYRTPAGVDPGVHRRAGELLRRFHDQASRPSDGTDAAATRRALRWLDTSDAIAPEMQARLRHALAALPPVEDDLVPTHGDWQPRNWLVDGGVVRVIDFGRFAFRPAATDFVRLAAQEWRENPTCETAFFEGYGRDPKLGSGPSDRASGPSHWLLLRLREAIGTACWAHQVGDEAFEAQGHRMIADALAEFER
ncbi:aminoglycoside phosphotransferase [Microbacterium sp. B35-04]|uniref:phosphotransferase n=1 Tax=unclassified Microbacterium TaxID=2609290 RepID=UPI0013D82B02|nr:MULTISPECIES: aminoglycoside phosphotransferase family protein [unclassified Microbacterium]KAF2411938.1 aminoglycoside phosphotransferase [Microbacterium sp. B35-04]KAF2418355.1 aminoglycoside phosphotransferase [Microbacterium sp. B35-30]